MDAVKVGNFIRELRKKNGLTQKMFGENILIKNMNKTEFNLKNEDKTKNINNNYKTRFQSICTNYIKIGDDRKNKKAHSKKKFNLPKKKEEILRLSVYESIKEKIKDPHNIMEKGYDPNIITGEIINLPDNIESIDFINKQSKSNDIKINDNNKINNKEIINEK